MSTSYNPSVVPIGNTDTVVYAVTSKRTSIINAASVSNYSGANATITVYLVPDGGSVGNATLALTEFSVSAGDTRILNALLGQGVTENGTIVAVSDTADAINLTINVVDIFL